MTTDHATQPDADNPVQRAKALLREARYATVDGQEKVPMASGLSGAPLVHLATGKTELSIAIDGLAMTCTAKTLSDEEVTHTAPRYVTRHGMPQSEGQFMHLIPGAVCLDGEDIDLSAVLTEGDGELMAYERRAVDHMNDDHLDAVKNYAEVLLGAQKGEWRLASLDMEGLDLVRCDANGVDFRRLWFHPPLASSGDIKTKLVELAMAGRAG